MKKGQDLAVPNPRMPSRDPTAWLGEQSDANLSLPASSEILRECREDRAIYLLIPHSFQ
jgi:hypothetical protein